jgi:hypothetical protein
MPATYEPIATTTLGTAAASITFSSIAATYTDLRLVFVGAVSSATGAKIRLNSDTGSNYSTTAIYGTGSAAGSERGAASFYNASYGDVLSTTVPSLVTADLFSYAGSTNKTALTEQSSDYNGTGAVTRAVSLWRNTAAITSVQIYVSTGTFNIGTTATLYGIKNA